MSIRLRTCILLCFFYIIFPFSVAWGKTAQPFKSIAFYYGTHPPLDELHAFDIAVINDAPDIHPQIYNVSHNSELFAYVSIGEVYPTQIKNHSVSQNWILGKNKNWQTSVVDLSNPDWQHWMLIQNLEPLWKKGYRGFFFDTLDSYMGVTHDPVKIKAEQAGLISLVKTFKQAHPTAKIIFNRGFEVLPAVKNDIYAVAAESLYQQWDPSQKIYKSVSANDRHYILNQFSLAKAMGLPCIAIDYVPASQLDKAQQTAELIVKQGIIPWVADKDLNNLGVSTVKVIPRKILILYSGGRTKTGLFVPDPLLNGYFPLEYMGYVPELLNVNDALPDYPLSGRYAGVIVWGYSTSPTTLKKVNTWLAKQKNKHIPIMFITSLNFLIGTPNINYATLQSEWGLKIPTQPFRSKIPRLKITIQSSEMGYEAQPRPQDIEFMPMQTINSKILLQIADEYSQREDVAAITPWGGYAIYPFVTIDYPNGINRWLINPFQFFSQALRLRVLPAPDTTTENGRRLMMVHIDGDGFPSETQWKEGSYAGVEMNNQILKRYRIPTDVSIIEGEIGPKGLFPGESKQMMQAARTIFAEPWIEIATHTFSHPFNWQLMYHEKQNGIYNLPVKNYQYNLQSEITGSRDFINHYLAPPGKYCKMIFWSGYTNIDKKTLKLSYDDHLNNINGYASVVSKPNFSLTAVDALGVSYGGYFQVFATNANEDNYTNSWTGPFYGFSQVINAFELTDKPRRYKPIDIYYHFYAATKIASLKALNKVYTWALAQHVFNAFESDYSNIVLDFNRTTFSTPLNENSWIITNNGYLRELRFPKSQGYPDLLRSQNVVGFSSYGQDYYIHLGNETRSILYLSKQLPSAPYLYDANARVIRFVRNGKNTQLDLAGYLPIEFTMANMQNCNLFDRNNNVIQPTKVAKKSDMELKSYNLAEKISNGMEIRC